MAQRPQLPVSQNSRQKQQHPLDTLQAMINAVLIETGKALRSANKKGIRSIGHDNERLQAFIPSAIDKFQAALDEIESDIVRAKAVLSRDLRELRAKQYELAHQTTEHTRGLEPSDNPLAQTNQDASALLAMDEVDGRNEDVASKDPSTSTRTDPPEIKMEATLDPLSAEGQTDFDPQESLAKLELQNLDGEKGGIGDEQFLKAELGPDLGLESFDTANSGASEAAELQSMNFDSLFDTSGTHNDPELNFDDLDFGPPGASDQDHDFGNVDGGLDLSSFGGQANHNNDDVNSLLQGLEDYADSGGGADFALLDMSHHATSHGGMEQGGTSGMDDFGMSGADLDMAMGLGANESTFDDLLESMDLGDGGDDGTGGEMMEPGEFDDAFYGIS